jgi:hypothetical protein
VESRCGRQRTSTNDEGAAGVEQGLSGTWAEGYSGSRAGGTADVSLRAGRKASEAGEA